MEQKNKQLKNTCSNYIVDVYFPHIFIFVLLSNGIKIGLSCQVLGVYQKT